jgi:CDP-diglyceride synthetase
MDNLLTLVLKIIFMFCPVILGGICNMVFVKLPVLKSLSVPIDGGINLKDGKRLFGGNKTWKGFIGMIVFTAFWFTVIAVIARSFGWAKEISLLQYSSYHTPFTELLYGSLWGFSYVLFELPNSFIKRRIGIPAGKNIKGLVGAIFTFVDQADSVLGCMLFMPIFYTPTVIEVLLFFIVGSGIHYVINVFLFLVKLKKQAR